MSDPMFNGDKISFYICLDTKMAQRVRKTIFWNWNTFDELNKKSTNSNKKRTGQQNLSTKTLSLIIKKQARLN